MTVGKVDYVLRWGWRLLINVSCHALDSGESGGEAVHKLARISQLCLHPPTLRRSPNALYYIPLV